MVKIEDLSIVRRGASVELVEVFGRHRSDSFIRVFVEAVQCDIFPKQFSLHKTLNNNSNATSGQWLHDDANSCRTRFNTQVLDWGFTHAHQFLERELA